MRRAFFAVLVALIPMLGTLKPATAQTVDDSIPALTSRAQKGNADAQNSLGLMYDNGQGVPQNHAEAVKWYRLAADQGDARAQFNLGFVYADGQGVPQSDVIAHMWYNLAGAQGVADALKYRDRLASTMTPAQIAEAQRLAAQWQRKGQP